MPSLSASCNFLLHEFGEPLDCPTVFKASVQACVLALLCAAAGCQRHANPDSKPREEAKPVPVESALIDEHPVPKMITVTGTLEADRRTELAANASGLVLRTFVE